MRFYVKGTLVSSTQSVVAATRAFTISAKASGGGNFADTIDGAAL